MPKKQIPIDTIVDLRVANCKHKRFKPQTRRFETTFSANKGGLKTTIIANETANIIFKLQTRVFKPH